MASHLDIILGPIFTRGYKKPTIARLLLDCNYRAVLYVPPWVEVHITPWVVMRMCGSQEVQPQPSNFIYFGGFVRPLGVVNEHNNGLFGA